MNGLADELLYAHGVLRRGAGWYWQVAPGRGPLLPLASDAVYLPCGEPDVLEPVLAGLQLWFLPHGATQLDAEQVGRLTAQLERLARMPDETRRRTRWLRLVDWLAGPGQGGICIQRQRFGA